MVPLWKRKWWISARYWLSCLYLQCKSYWILSICITINQYNLKLGFTLLCITNVDQLFFLLFLCFHLFFNSSSLFMSISKLIWININITDTKRHILICFFISMLMGKRKEWGSYAWKWVKYKLSSELSLKLSRDNHMIDSENLYIYIYIYIYIYWFVVSFIIGICKEKSVLLVPLESLWWTWGASRWFCNIQSYGVVLEEWLSFEQILSLETQ